MRPGKLGIPFINISNPEIELYLILSRLSEQPPATQVRERLKNDDRCQRLFGKFLNYGGGSGGQFDLNSIIYWWILRTNEKGSQQADEELELYLSSDDIEVWRTVWLYGPLVEDRITIADGVDLVPPHLMPASAARDNCLRSYLDMSTTADIPPTCAMVTVNHEKKIINSEELHIDDLINRKQLDLALIMNSLPGVFALSGLQTSHLPDHQPPGRMAGSGGGQALYDIVPRHSSHYRSSTDIDLEDLYGRFKIKPLEEQQALRRALLRLSYAKARRGSPHNQALDLGICLETLLLGETKADQLSLTLKLRGAWLIGNTVEERVNLANILSHAYTLRSNVAHNGYDKKLQTKEFEPYLGELNKHFDITERIARTLLAQPRPNWNELILGG